MSEIAYRSALDLAADLASRRLSARETLDALLRRIDAHDAKINAVVATDVERAWQRAAAADQATADGESWGPLHGVPMTVKDTFEVAGMPCTAGAPELAGHVPDADAVAVARLAAAGAIVFGKTNVPIWAGDFQSYNEVYGTTANPWDPARTPGGSSGGSAAALAAGFTPLELGSDIGGSIRSPAHFCGVFGHKPTYGIVPMRGHIPGPPGMMAEADISVAGPLARNAADLEAALSVLAGPDRDAATAWSLGLPPPRATRLDGFRVAAWLHQEGYPLEGDVAVILQRAVRVVEDAGAAVDRSARPVVDVAASYRTFLHLLYGVMTAAFSPALLAAMEERAAAADPGDGSALAEMARAAIQPHRAWLRRNEARYRIRAAWSAFFADYDVLLCPVMPTVAFPHDHRPMGDRTIDIDGTPFPYLDQMFWAGLAGVAGLPATTAPVGHSPGGLPIGIQIVGPYLEDRTTIAFAGALEQEIGGFVAPGGHSVPA